MNETMVTAVVTALFEKLKAMEAGHPWAVLVIDGLETVALKEVPTLLEMVQGKLGGG